LFVSALPAQAGFLYGNLSGTLVDFVDIAETSTTHPHTQLYGQPYGMGDSVLYFPSTFVSEATGGEFNSVQGTLSMTLNAKDGFIITGLQITEYGYYSLTGVSTTGNTYASVGAEYFAGGLTGSLDVTPGGIFSLPSHATSISGDFTASRSLAFNFNGPGLKTVDFHLSNLLATNSEEGTTALIQKNLGQFAVEVEFYTAPVPIPGAVWLLGSALGPVYWMRRRRRS